MTAAVSRTRTLTRRAVEDGALGASAGLLLACAYVAASVDLGQMATSGAPLEHLAGLIAYAAAQGSLLAGLGGVFLRRALSPD